MSEHAEWLDEPETRGVIRELKVKIDRVTRGLLVNCSSGTLEQIRADAAERKALLATLQLIEGEKNEQD